MNSASSSSTATMFIQIIIAVLGIVGLYYLYKYLFDASQVAPTALVVGKQDASKLPVIIVPSKNLPPLFTGGSFAISSWIYVKSINAIGSGNPKSIIRIGGANFDTMRIFLGGQGAQLMIKFDTGAIHTLVQSPNSFAAAQPFQSKILDEDSGACDIIQMDMQRWIHLVVSVNGMACDVYMDGKLVRSCPLPNYFNIDGADYSVKILDNGAGAQGGFGGAISTTNMYGRALTPDIVYQMYMAGPEPVTDFLTYISSFFTPSVAY